MKSNRPNIFLFTIDDLRRDCLKTYNPKINVDTKNINIFAQDSIIFKNAFSVGSNTPNVLPSIFTGFKPIFFPKHKIPYYIKTIPEYLKERGYLTSGFNEANAWCTELFGFAKGFDQFNSYLNLASLSDAIGLSNRMNKQMRTLSYIMHKLQEKIPNNKPLNHMRLLIETLKFELIDINKIINGECILQKKFINDIMKHINLSGKRSSFSWVHFMVNHWPWIPDLDNTHRQEIIKYNRKLFLSKIFRNDFIRCRRKLYLKTVKTLDLYFGRILDELKRKEIYNNSMIIFTSDHGELFGEHDQTSHPSKIYRELIEIPLIIKLPDNENYVVEKYFDNSQIFQLIKNYINYKSLRIDRFENDVLLAMNYEFRDAFKEYKNKDKKKLVSFAIISNEMSLRVQNGYLEIFEGIPILEKKISLKHALMNKNLEKIQKKMFYILNDERKQLEKSRIRAKIGEVRKS